MGIFDSNIAVAQGRERHGNIVVDLEATNTYTVDTKGYNTLALQMTAVAPTNVQIEVVGYYSDFANTQYAKLYGIDVSGIQSWNSGVPKEIKTVTAGFVNVFLYDVSKFEKVTVKKTTIEGKLSAKYNLFQNPISDTVNWQFFRTRRSSSTAAFNQQNTAISFDGQKENINAVLLKITSDIEFNSVPFYGVLPDGSTKHITKRCYNIDKQSFLADNEKYKAGTSYIYVPREEFEQVYLHGGILNGASVAIEYKFGLFDFDVFDKRINYWDKQTGNIGYNNYIRVPDTAKSLTVFISGDTVNTGKTVNMYYIPWSIEKTADHSKALSLKQYVLTAENQIDILDVSEIGFVSFGNTSGVENVSIQLLFSKQVASLSKPFDIVFQNDTFEVMKVKGVRDKVSLLRNVAVFWDATSLAISQSGVHGRQEVVQFNSTNFPNLIDDSTIERLIVLPWQRNGSEANGFGGYDWRINVITNRGQIYHNFPNRAQNGAGNALTGDHKRFDESVVWELAERKTPVKTKTGDDATLINTGKYYYFPALPDESYEFHPAINHSSYGHSGFPAVVEKDRRVLNEEDGTSSTETVKFSRFYFTDRSRGYQSNPLGFMGGFEPDAKLNLLATYKSNVQATGSTRMCVFASNDGGREWYCIYEFGERGELIDQNKQRVAFPSNTFLNRNLKAVGMSSNAPGGLYTIVHRRQYCPTAEYKEPELIAKFNYVDRVNVASIVAGESDIVVNTESEHGFNHGDVILFKKQEGAPSNEWDWIVNEDATDNECYEPIFKVLPINSTSFRLKEAIANPNNNLRCRHIHSINRGKDHFVIGTGEKYPEGFIIYVPMRQSDSFMRKFPWDKFDFIRLTSTKDSIQRPLGVVVEQDSDNTVFIGVDNEMTNLPNVAMPEGRTHSFKRSSNSVFKGKLVDVDDQSKFECVLESREVSYFFKKINGYFIHIGQQGHLAISKTGEKGTWSECHLNASDQSRYYGISSDGYISISNHLIKIR